MSGNIVNDSGSSAVTVEDVTSQIAQIRNDTESTVKFVERLFGQANELQTKLKILNARLNEETVRRNLIENERNNLQRLKDELQEKVRELVNKCNELNNELLLSEQRHAQSLNSKEQEIEHFKIVLETQEEAIRGVKLLKKNLEAFRVGRECFEEPFNACLLPNGNIVAVDAINGIFLFSNHTELLKQLQSDQWKWPQGLTYHTAAGHVLISLLRRNSASRWRRAIGVFDQKLELVSFMDGPDDDDSYDTVAKESLVYDPKSDCLLLCVADNLGSAFYRRSMSSPDKKWTMVYQRQGVTYLSMQVLMCTDMVSEVLVVEGRSSYLYKLVLTDGRAANRKLYIPAERPTAVCLDEDRQLFVFDAIVGKIIVVSSVTFEKKHEVGLVEEHVTSMNASRGFLCVTLKESKSVIVFKYKTVDEGA